MERNLIQSTLPYVAGLAVAVLLFYFTKQLEYTPRAGALGPQVWPQIAILLLSASCIYEIVRRMIVGNRDATGLMEAFEREGDNEQAEPVYPRMLVGGIALMAVYAVLVPYLGFIFGTFLFLVAFMYVGGFRRHKAIWLTSIFVTLLCGVLFLRVAYVSLPRGIEPFAYATDIFFKIPAMW
ncbi:MAG: tripartite tricarboxylate transporter TctB family protein [Afipia sp.]